MAWFLQTTKVTKQRLVWERLHKTESLFTKERDLLETEAFSPATRPYVTMRQEMGKIDAITRRRDSIVSRLIHANGGAQLIQVLDLRRPLASVVCDSAEGEPPLRAHAVRASRIAAGDGSPRMHA